MVELLYLLSKMIKTFLSKKKKPNQLEILLNNKIYILINNTNKK